MEKWMADIIEFPMKRRMGQIHAARAWSIIEEKVENYPLPRPIKEEMKIELLDVVTEWIDEEDPTTEELDALLDTLTEPQEVIIWEPKSDNDNE